MTVQTCLSDLVETPNREGSCIKLFVLGTIEDYKLLEQMNKVTLSKYSEMKNLSTAVGNALQDLNDRCKKTLDHKGNMSM